MAAPETPLRTIRFFDKAGRPTEQPDALWLALERAEIERQAWLRRQLEALEEGST